jgi:hypothetical protein
MAIRVTVTDTETGDTETQEIANDVLVVTAGACYIAHVQDYPGKGTQVYTIKGRGGAA